MRNGVARRLARRMPTRANESPGRLLRADRPGALSARHDAHNQRRLRAARAPALPARIDARPARNLCPSALPSGRDPQPGGRMRALSGSTCVSACPRRIRPAARSGIPGSVHSRVRRRRIRARRRPVPPAIGGQSCDPRFRSSPPSWFRSSRLRAPSRKEPRGDRGDRQGLSGRPSGRGGRDREGLFIKHPEAVGQILAELIKHRSSAPTSAGAAAEPGPDAPRSAATPRSSLPRRIKSPSATRKAT